MQLYLRTKHYLSNFVQTCCKLTNTIYFSLNFNITWLNDNIILCFEMLIIYKPMSWGHVRSYTKRVPNPFSHLDVYWIQKKTDRQAKNKYRNNIKKLSIHFCILKRLRR